jgi:ATP-binding cassette subfamily B protein
MHFRQLLSYARPYRARLLGLAALTTASSLVLLFIPWLAGQLFGGIVSASANHLDTIVPLLVLSLSALALLNFALASQSATTAARVLADLRCAIYEHVQRLPMGFHHSRQKGDTLALLTLEVARLGQFLTGTLVNLPSRLLMTLGALALMFRIDARLALTVPLLIPAFYLILKIVGRRQRTLSIALQQHEARVVAIADETLEMLPATKAFTRERAQSARYGSAVAQVFAKSVRIGRIAAALEPLIALVASLAAIGILLAAGRSVQAGGMTPAEFFSFIFYAALLTRPVGALADVYGQVQMARGTLARLHSVLDLPGEVASGSALPERAVGHIAFEDVHFAYPGRPQTLSGVSFRIKAGETVALTGVNGAGKTAIINLLIRFFEPQSGTIRVDGVDIAEMDLAQLRRQIGLVPQTTFLLNGTIRDNIAFGAEDPGAAEIDRAARLAQAHAFIAQMPEAMDTVIGDRGVRLSGGQRQRIALARALIKDPPILLLDEATAMFDEEGEAAFIRDCSEALSARTVILITHRPATLALADRILLLEDGALHEVDLKRAKLSAIRG